MKACAIPFSFLLILFLASCGKNDSKPTSQGVLSARLDGQLHTFRNVNAWGIASNDDHIPVIIIGGLAENKMTDALYITVTDEDLLSEFSFQSTEYCWTDSNCIWINYNLLEGTPDEYNISCGDQDGSSSVVNFSALDFREEGTVSGTFSGTFIDDRDGTPVQVTEGKFQATIIEMQ